MRELIDKQYVLDALWAERKRLDILMDDCLRNGEPEMRAAAKIERNQVEADWSNISRVPAVGFALRWIPVSEEPPVYPCIIADVNGNRPRVPTDLIYIEGDWVDGRIFRDVGIEPLEGLYTKKGARLMDVMLRLARGNRITYWCPLPPRPGEEEEEDEE